MPRREFIAGANFSGRSAALRSRLQNDFIPGHTFYVGPYAEAALSGLTSMVCDEIALYQCRGDTSRPVFGALEISDALLRDPQSLSGGEQILLAMHCFSQSDYQTIAVDTALEQLDTANRAAALAYLGSEAFSAVLIDNRGVPPGWSVHAMREPANEYAIDWSGLAAVCEPGAAANLAISGLKFRYRGGSEIFRDVTLDLTPGRAYRLSGRNGAGKTTFFKLLVGALAPASGRMTLGGESYVPWQKGNRALALATQNPDQQWCGTTLREDMVRRRRAVTDIEARRRMSEDRVQQLATMLGVSSLDRHLYELPLAARKRVGWCWPFIGAHPWIMLDEPTVGQDAETRMSLARHLALMCTRGYGVMFVSHDDEFAAALPHDVLQVAEGMITQR